MENILIVEDEIKVIEVVKAYLEREGYRVYTALRGKNALDILENEEIHLIILDLMLPDLSGEQICKKVREKSNIPILMLTAKSTEEDKINGLVIGADDYLVKPFSPRELVARIKAIFRRTFDRFESREAREIICFKPNLEIDLKKMLVRNQGIEIMLTPVEYKLLMVFAEHPFQVFSREQLIDKVLGMDFDGYDRTIDVHIKNLRHKIEEESKKPKYILTVYGHGYKFGGEKV